MNLQIKYSDIGAVVLALVAFWNPNIDFNIGPDKNPPAPVGPAVPAPPLELQQLVIPLAARVTELPDRAALAEYYAAFADVLRRDGGTAGRQKIATIANLAAVNEAAGTLMYQQTGIGGKYAGLAEAIDKTWGGWMGIVDPKGGFAAGPLDEAKRARAVDFETALQWAFSQPLEKPQGVAK